MFNAYDTAFDDMLYQTRSASPDKQHESVQAGNIHDSSCYDLPLNDFFDTYMSDTRTRGGNYYNTNEEISDRKREMYTGRFRDTHIPKSERLAEAPTRDLPALNMQPLAESYARMNAKQEHDFVKPFEQIQCPKPIGEFRDHPQVKTIDDLRGPFNQQKTETFPVLNVRSHDVRPELGRMIKRRPAKGIIMNENYHTPAENVHEHAPVSGITRPQCKRQAAHVQSYQSNAEGEDQMLPTHRRPASHDPRKIDALNDIAPYYDHSQKGVIYDKMQYQAEPTLREQHLQPAIGFHAERNSNTVHNRSEAPFTIKDTQIHESHGLPERESTHYVSAPSTQRANNRTLDELSNTLMSLEGKNLRAHDEGQSFVKHDRERLHTEIPSFHTRDTQPLRGQNIYTHDKCKSASPYINIESGNSYASNLSSDQYRLKSEVLKSLVNPFVEPFDKQPTREPHIQKSNLKEELITSFRPLTSNVSSEVQPTSLHARSFNDKASGCLNNIPPIHEGQQSGVFYDDHYENRRDREANHLRHIPTYYEGSDQAAVDMPTPSMRNKQLRPSLPASCNVFADLAPLPLSDEQVKLKNERLNRAFARPEFEARTHAQMSTPDRTYKDLHVSSVHPMQIDSHMASINHLPETLLTHKDLRLRATQPHIDQNHQAGPIQVENHKLTFKDLRESCNVFRTNEHMAGPVQSLRANKLKCKEMNHDLPVFDVVDHQAAPIVNTSRRPIKKNHIILPESGFRSENHQTYAPQIIRPRTMTRAHDQQNTRFPSRQSSVESAPDRSYESTFKSKSMRGLQIARRPLQNKADVLPEAHMMGQRRMKAYRPIQGPTYVQSESQDNYFLPSLSERKSYDSTIVNDLESEAESLQFQRSTNPYVI